MLASIVQWIERELPELKVGVRFPLGAQKNTRYSECFCISNLINYPLLPRLLLPA